MTVGVDSTPRGDRFRPLGEDEVADLERIVLAGIRKRPPAHIEEMEREPAPESRISVSKLRDQLRRNGATDDEIEVLLTERVELNAMSSAQLVEFIEDKLAEHGIQKVFPIGGP
jgi:Flp pilus assembly secretin CpaC